jgi:prophage regulatory protein
MLRLSDLTKLVGLSRSTIYKMIERGEFPRGVHAGFRARRWRMAEVADWQARLAD